MKKNKWFHSALTVVVVVYLLIPLAATLAYALATDWSSTILPKSWTFQWFAQLFSDERFAEALKNSFLVCTISIILSLLVMLPTVFIVTIYLPRWEALLNGVVLLPFAIPGVIAAVGLLKTYSSGLLPIAGTIYIVIGAYFVLILPYMYQGIRNSMRTINAVELLNAAELLGCSKITAFRKVVIPNLLPGIIVSVLLSFSILFGEFVLVNLLVGSQFETIQIYLFSRLNESGHIASAVAISYFLFVLIISAAAAKLSKWLFKFPKTD